METITEIRVRKIQQSRLPEVDFTQLEFGKYVSDHMLICDYAQGEWHTPHIVPYGNLSASPAMLALHYGQTAFEGMKAFRQQDGQIVVFRMERHYQRFLRSLERMCMPFIPREIFVEGIRQLLVTDAGWVPAAPGTSFYIRPFMYASEAKFGIKVSDEYRFIVFGGPVPALYASPIRVKVETEYVRAAKGGTGFAKCGGNYGGAFLPTQKAKQEGYDQVLWTDAKENRFIEESGMMNVMFVINDTLVTPPLSGTILDGITRDSLLTLAKDLAYKTEERRISIEELTEGLQNGSVTEAFGAGTAAVILPIGVIGIDGVDYTLPALKSTSISSRLKRKLERIRNGVETDTYQWNDPVS